MIASNVQPEPSIPQYALDYVEAARETTARAPVETPETVERAGEGKGDGRGDATHIAASKPEISDDELSHIVYGFKEGETPNQRALQNAEDNQPRNDGSVLAVAAILAAENANDQQPQGQRIEAAQDAPQVQQDAPEPQGRSLDDYARSRGLEMGGPQPHAAQQPEQDGPSPQGRSLDDYAKSRGLPMNQQAEASIPAYAMDYVQAQKTGQQQEGPSKEPSIPDYAIVAMRPEPNQPIHSNGLSR